MDDLEVPPFMETSIYWNPQLWNVEPTCSKVTKFADDLFPGYFLADTYVRFKVISHLSLYVDVAIIWLARDQIDIK